MHPEISRGIAAERMRDMQALAARGRLARRVRGRGRITRRVFHAARPAPRPALVAPVQAQRDCVDAQVTQWVPCGEAAPDRAA
jgi:hypothetical protein